MPTRSETPATRSADAAVDDALARAVVYRTLSVAFQSPAMRRGDWMSARERFATAIVALGHLAGRDSTGSLAVAATQLLPPAPAAVDAAAAAYWRLFGHTARGPVCLCETEYGPDNAFHQPQQLADIAGYYLAFGLRSGAASDVRADHLASECEFMDFLCRKEAVLLGDGECAADREETLETTRRAGRTFLRDHLGRFACAVGARLAAEDADGYYGTVGRLLLTFVRAECARVGVENGPIDLAVRSVEVDETPMACGSSPELIQIQRGR
jgi:TorA maturation chaperone TorD